MDFIYSPVSKTLQDFHNDTSFLKLIAGPPGSGKSSAIVAELMFRAMRQKPHHDGVRRTRMGIFRQTYSNLKNTVMRTVRQWVPSEWGRIRETVPIRAVYTFPCPFDNGATTVETEWLFIAIDSNIDSLLSLELSSAFINEATEMDEQVLDRLITRVGRYPAVKDGAGCSEAGIILDFNLTSKNHWIYRLAEIEPNEITRDIGQVDQNGKPILYTTTKKFFKQPPAVFCTNIKEVEEKNEIPNFIINKDADNISNLQPGYYANLLKERPTRQQWYEILRMTCMEWVKPVQGRLVFENEYRRQEHISSSNLQPVNGKPVVIGIDTSGVHPCAVFCQHINGSLMVYNELYGDNVAFSTFVSDMLLPTLSEVFPGFETIAICDPANARGSDTGVTPIQQLVNNGIKAIPASTNDFSLRREAVSRLLMKRNGLLISLNCEGIIDGFETSYVYPKLKINTDQPVFSDRPDKRSSSSHYMDALQYAALHITRLGALKANKNLENLLKKERKPQYII